MVIRIVVHTRTVIATTGEDMTENQKHLLVIYRGNWADEMDIDGFFTTTQEWWDAFVERVNKHFENDDMFSYYVGTNEEIDYPSAQDLLHDFKIQEITAEEDATLKKLFRGGTLGFTGPDVE